MTRSLSRLALLASCLAPSCAGAPEEGADADGEPSGGAADTSPLGFGWAADELIGEDEVHLARLWQLTRGGENAEGYFSFGGDRIVYQRRAPAGGIPCDRIFVLDGSGSTQVSDGRGVTTCSYFLPGDREVLFASTRASMEGCPPRPDYSLGYVWSILPEYDLWTRDLATGTARRLTSEWGYDAEATVSPVGDRIVFTSTRSGDLELWTCDLDGQNLFQVTDVVGYDGGGFFSHDGRSIVFRSTRFTPGKEAEEHAAYRELLGQDLIRPSAMEIMLVNADGTGRRQLTHLGGANFAPFFFPDDQAVIFSTNHANPDGRNFDLYRISVDGTGLEPVTTYDGFDSFPMFDPGGQYLVFASNRGGTEQGETNLFLAQWR